MAGAAFPLPHALQANLLVLDEPGGAVLWRSDGVHQREELCLGRELADAIITFLAARNDNPQRYVWKAKGEDILRQIDAARRALSQCNSISDTSH
jgi:hypothetical protein